MLRDTNFLAGVGDNLASRNAVWGIMRPATITGDRSMLHRAIPLFLFALVVAYAALLLSTFFMGIWLIDSQGQAVATDFIAFWAAGKLALQGHAVDAYNWAIHKDVATQEAGTAFTGLFTWQYPPTFMLVTPLLALMPYPVALLVWMGLGIGLYLAAIRLSQGNWHASVAALAWPAVFWNVVVGQNGFLIAALLGGGIALIEKRPALAGILFGLLTFKPQFGLLIPVALIAGGHLRVVGFAGVGAFLLAGVSATVFGVDAWTAFVDSAGRINSAILSEGRTQFSELQSLYGYARTLGFASPVAWSAHGLLCVVLCGMVVKLWRDEAGFDIKAAALASATILASPYSFIYDLVALAVPLAFLGRSGFSIRELATIAIAGILVGWGPAEHIPTGLTAALLVLGLVIARMVGSQASPAQRQSDPAS